MVAPVCDKGCTQQLRHWVVWLGSYCSVAYCCPQQLRLWVRPRRWLRVAALCSVVCCNVGVFQKPKNGIPAFADVVRFRKSASESPYENRRQPARSGKAPSKLLAHNNINVDV